MAAQPGFYQRARALFPHIPQALLQVYAQAWAETGDAQQAAAIMRQDPRYDTYYAGNRREDGSIRMDERQYYARNLRYNQILESFGLPIQSEFFKGKFKDLVEGEKSMQQFEADMASVYVGIVQQAPQVRQYFAENFMGNGAELSTAAIFASALDTSKSPLVYEQEIRTAQIGGAAKVHSFDLDVAEVQRLSAFGLQAEAANTLFSTAARAVPTIAEMVNRHNDPDDEFDINDYTNALVVKDADDLRRLTRVIGAEESLFRTGSAINQDQLGRLTGLSDY